MKAIVIKKYGLPERLVPEEVPTPVPNDGQVLVQIHASSVNYNTLIRVIGRPFLARLMGVGLFKPKFKITGNDIAGRVTAVGKNIKQFKPGDEVYGDLASCGLGAYAEYVCVPESALALKPANLTFAQAAAVPEAAVVALQGLRDLGKIRSGQEVLIYGASGGIGTFAVQIAKSFGARVTGVCSTRNLDLVRSLGADEVIDHTKDDFLRSGRLYDLILATAGYRPLRDYHRALTPAGRYVATGGTMTGPKGMAQVFEPMFLGWWITRKDKKRIVTLTLNINQKDLMFMKELIEAGKVKPVVDRQYPFSEVAEALRYYGEGHSRGKVLITIQ
jgi:NADPH:quinone reductase-like Zn-dependent oxidoreductase